MYKKSIEDPQEFWKEIAQEFHFETPQPTDRKFFEYNFNVKNGPIYTKLMDGATTNICYNPFRGINDVRHASAGVRRRVVGRCRLNNTLMSRRGRVVGWRVVLLLLLMNSLIPTGVVVVVPGRSLLRVRLGRGRRAIALCRGN